MNLAEASHYYFTKAAKLMEVSDRVATLLTNPLREITVQIPIEMDDGQIKTFVGYRIQHDNARGPMKGGIRFHPSVNREQMQGIAALMTWKTAVVNLPYGGAAGGVACQPASLSPRELERLTRKLVDQIQDVIGPTRDIPGPDLNTNPQVMAWMMDQYSKYRGHTPAVVTGKPVELYGCRGRDSASGRGLQLICREILRDIGMEVRGTRFAVQGFGHVGRHAVRLLAEDGARIVAVSEEGGGTFNPNGLDVPALLEHFRTSGSIKGFAGGQAIAPADALLVECDVLIPAALPGSLTGINAGSVRAKIVVEGANGPTDPEADEILEKRGIITVPDILAGAGGVTVSYFEWVQNIQQFTWEEERVNAELEKLLKDAYERTAHLAKTRRVSLRTAAYALAIGRVGKATVLRGV